MLPAQGNGQEPQSDETRAADHKAAIRRYRLVVVEADAAVDREPGLVKPAEAGRINPFHESVEPGTRSRSKTGKPGYHSTIRWRSTKISSTGSKNLLRPDRLYLNKDSRAEPEGIARSENVGFAFAYQMRDNPI
jgi:hypothetical protein